MSSANKKHMQGGMNTTYSNVNTEDERNKKSGRTIVPSMGNSRISWTAG